MVAAEKIGEVLGGEAILKREIHTLDDLLHLTEEGLPKKSLAQILGHAFNSKAERSVFKHKIIPEATFKRRKAKLNPAESQKVERIARIIATSEYVWDDREQSIKFLTSKNPALGDNAPILLTLTELGARKVEMLLWQIFHGIPY